MRSLPYAAVSVVPPRKSVLNKTAAVLWMLLEAKHTLTEMAEALVARFAVDWEQAYRDATAFCEDLLSFGAVEELITGSSTA